MNEHNYFTSKIKSANVSMDQATETLARIVRLRNEPLQPTDFFIFPTVCVDTDNIYCSLLISTGRHHDKRLINAVGVEVLCKDAVVVRKKKGDNSKASNRYFSNLYVIIMIMFILTA